MSDTCRICGEEYPNCGFPLYPKYGNDARLPCVYCWYRMDDATKKLTIEKIDEEIKLGE